MKWLTCFFMALRPDKYRFLSMIFAMALLEAPIGAFGQTSLSLSDAIRLSQEHSYSIKSARSDSMAAAFDLSAAKAGRFPTLSLSAVGSYINKVQSITLPLVGSKTLGIKDNYQADLKLSLPLFTGGRISNQIKIQTVIAEGKAYSLQLERLDNAYLTRKAYLGFMASQAVTASASASFSRLKIIRDDVQNLYNAGMADSVDILEAEIALEKAQQNLDLQMTQQQNATSSLARLIGLGNADSISAPDSMPIPDFDTFRNIKPSIEEINRPELQAIDSKVYAANLAVRLNASNYFPIFSGFGGYSYGKPNKDLFNHTWNDYWTAGLNLNWDFNLGGKTIYNVNSAKETATSIKMTKSDLEESLLLEAQTSLQNLALSYKSYVVLQRQFDLSQREFHLAENQERAGKISVNRLLELEANLTATEQLFRVSQINYYLSESDYLYAIGSPKIYGGF
jgi:outer membrane protein